MAKRKRKAAARKKTSPKRSKRSTRTAAARTKTTKSKRRKAVAKKVRKRPAVKAKTKKRAARKKAARPAKETAKQAASAEITEQTIVDIIEEPVPGMVIVTELESIKTTKPEESDEGFD